MSQLLKQAILFVWQLGCATPRLPMWLESWAPLSTREFLRWPLFTKVVTVDCFRNSWVLLTSLGENCGKLVLPGFVLLGFASHTSFTAFILNLLAVVVRVIIFWIALDSLAGFLYVSPVSPLCLAHDYSASVLESRFWWTAGVLDTLGKNVLQEGADAPVWETEG